MSAANYGTLASGTISGQKKVEIPGSINNVIELNKSLSQEKPKVPEAPPAKQKSIASEVELSINTTSPNAEKAAATSKTINEPPPTSRQSETVADRRQTKNKNQKSVATVPASPVIVEDIYTTKTGLYSAAFNPTPGKTRKSKKGTYAAVAVHQESTARVPPFLVDTIESPEVFFLIIDCPGLARDDLSIKIDQDKILTVSGEKRASIDLVHEIIASDREKNENDTPPQSLSEKGENSKGYNNSEMSLKQHRSERFSGQFQKKIQLPTNAVINHVTAKFLNGVLGIIVPKDAFESDGTIEVELQ